MRLCSLTDRNEHGDRGATVSWSSTEKARSQGKMTLGSGLQRPAEDPPVEASERSGSEHKFLRQTGQGLGARSLGSVRQNLGKRPHEAGRLHSVESHDPEQRGCV